MVNKKRFKVSDGLRKYIRSILTRMEIPNKFIHENDQWFCETVISGEKFHKIVQRAKCEKKTKEDGLLYLTYRESRDPLLAHALLEQFNSNGCAIISKKKEKTS